MPQTNNTKQAAWVAIGSLFSYGFAIVSSMILSRYFEKADYGTYKQVLFVYNSLLTIFTLGLPRAFSYFLPRVELRQAKSVIRKITNIFFFLGAVFSLLLFLFSHQIAVILNNEDLSMALKVFSPVPFFMLPTLGLEGILATYKRTKFMAVYTVLTKSLLLVCVALPVALFHYGYIQAIIGFDIASFITFILALYFKFLPVKGAGNDPCSLTLKEIIQFAIPLLVASVFGIIITSAPQFFISRYFGQEVFAEFSNGFIELPFVWMVASACSTVLGPIYSKLNFEGNNPKDTMHPLWLSALKKSAMIIYPILIYCWVFADVLMVLLYGQQYEVSAYYFRIKLLVDFLRIAVFSSLLINIGKTKMYSIVMIYTAVLIVLLEVIVVYTIKSPFAVCVVSVICSFVEIFSFFFVASKFFNVKVVDIFPIKVVLKILIPSIIILFGEHFLFVSVLELKPIFSTICSLVLYSILYLVCAKFVKLDYFKIIKPVLPAKYKNVLSKFSKNKI